MIIPRPTNADHSASATTSEVPSRLKKFFLVSTAFFVWLAAIVLVILFIKVEQSIWSVRFVDVLVIVCAVIALMIGGTMLLTLMRPASAPMIRIRWRVATWGAAALATLTVFVAYAAFRNQAVQSAEAALQDSGYALYEIEMSSAELRCLYFNYARADEAACLDSLVADTALWSKAIFYVEESWFQLSYAYRERRAWGTDYADNIKYWAQDIARDPTGLFTYYVVSSERNFDDVADTLTESGVIMSPPQVCANFQKVWQALVARRRQPAQVSGAARECGATGDELPISDDL